MKFYRDKYAEYDLVAAFDDKYYSQINDKQLNAIYHNPIKVEFLKNGLDYNTKNAAIVYINGYKRYCLHDIIYGDSTKFTKQSWRRFVKLQILL